MWWNKTRRERKEKKFWWENLCILEYNKKGKPDGASPPYSPSLDSESIRKGHIHVSVYINTYAHQRALEELEQSHSPRERDKWAGCSVSDGVPPSQLPWGGTRGRHSASLAVKERWIIFLCLAQTPPCTKWCLLPLENKIPHLCQCKKVAEKMVAV